MAPIYFSSRIRSDWEFRSALGSPGSLKLLDTKPIGSKTTLSDGVFAGIIHNPRLILRPYDKNDLPYGPAPCLAEPG